MTNSTRYSQPMAHEFISHTAQLESIPTAAQTNSEINRLLTAAVVNRGFCRLLLSNPLAALAGGYRGEAFRLNPVEVKRISAIQATSLRDFALQLLVNWEAEHPTEVAHSHDRQGAVVLAL